MYISLRIRKRVMLCVIAVLSMLAAVAVMPTFAKEEKTDLLNQVMYNLFNTIRKIGILLYPFIPDTSNKILEQLNIHDEYLTSYNSLKTTLDLTGNKVEEKVSPLFQRLEAKKEEEKLIELMKIDNEK